MAECNDLRLGGTLSASGITGATSINSTLLEVADWSGLFGWVGMSYNPVEISGRPGGQLVGDGLRKARLLTLNMRMTRAGASTPQDNLWDNTDTFLTLLATPRQYLEVDLADGSKRFTRITVFDPSSIAQPRTERTISVTGYSETSDWKLGGNEATASGTFNNTGPLSIYDAVITMGNGTLTNSTAGWSLTLAGAGGTATIDLGNRTVTDGGGAADDRLTITDREWGWFVPGNNTLSGTATITYRLSYP